MIRAAKPHHYAAAFVFMLLTITAVGHATAEDRDVYIDDPVRCESHDNKTAQCPIRGRARMVHQLSLTRCVEGDNWGQARGAVWVTRGCRAEFIAERPRRDRWRDRDRDWDDEEHGRTVICESYNLRENRCDIRAPRRVQLVKQKSTTRCREDHNWGWDRKGIWVSDGCRAEFRVY